MSETIAIPNIERTSVDVHAWWFVAISPYVSANSPTADVTSPGRSRRCSRDVSRVSSMNSRAATIPMMPIGMLMKKIQPQLIFSVRMPPTSGPIASAIADTPAQMPIAIPR